MNPETAKIEFETFIGKRHIPLETLTLSKGIHLLIEFYQQVRADGCPIDDDGDMLMFEWGVYDWGGGLFFQCHITRQFIKSRTEGDDGISQLTIRFCFPTSGKLAALESGSRWCSSLSELQSFKSFITESAAYRAVSIAHPSNVKMEYSPI